MSYASAVSAGWDGSDPLALARLMGSGLPWFEVMVCISIAFVMFTQAAVVPVETLY